MIRFFRWLLRIKEPIEHTPVVLDQKDQHEIILLIKHGYKPDGVARMYQVDIEAVKTITSK